MSDATHEYLFDVTLAVSIRVRAKNGREAQEKIIEAIRSSDANLGLLDGEPLICEPRVETLDIAEIDGEAQ